MLNRLSSFAKFFIFTATFFIGAFLDKLINQSLVISNAHFIFIWIMPIVILALLFIVHKLKITSKLTLFLLPFLTGTLGGLTLGGLSIFAEEATPLFSFMIIGIGIVIGTISGLLFSYLLDDNKVESEINHKWMLILSIAIPFIFYCIHHVYNLSWFNSIENIAQIILNLFATLLGILFLILNRNITKAWNWKTLAIFSILFSVFIFLGGLGGYRMNKLMDQLPDCVGNNTEHCIFRELE